MEYINGQRSRRKITVLFKRKGQRKNRGDMGKKIRVFSYSVFLLLITLESSFASSLSQSNSNQGIEHSISRNLKEDQSQVPEVHCSRERSRAAWKVIEEYLMPFLEREKYQLSSKCRLHPSNDIFRDQEENKIHVDINEWRCGYCKKIFRAEKYLDQHFDNRHLNLLNIDLADSCFPVNQGPPATRLHELFLRQFCDAHTCSGGRKPFSRGGRKHTSIFYLAISILILMFLPIFYLIVYLYQREMRTGGQQLKRISKPGRKPKPS
ncbi:uncharacterized protein LOC111399490 isoform X5 [Olea europaea subsp. europaea]|uniref:Uncharacterized protein LOC111399490 isoform X5 n=1 Tax=Olea europaea subsp. europaea TaxID=158383 RepID=A0A8S0UBT9_OLEEU|nr:uncharacterized protein LOC111399490 isoform X5 [Olea europaea subsp. europaea]